ncbi:flippase-like domain-containing protein [Panacibacter sp. DH6]|uniref:Flippase-like domain-containing protein n=1 Tax=Panacibacter microcysteis TaxID=2793269 RepID=A0A931E7V8_9BACT|nr:lysylphosphatidylglycerol synthase transmembrane domain-containing protein [Panacibacter microcysteis]MBG9377001.1 flippase-like domain-containing protein [Panacibacter microcysteis]
MAANNSVKSFLKLLLKIAVTVVCLWYVSSKVDWAKSFSLIQQSNWWWLIFATILFTASKVVSAFRLNIYFRNIGVQLSEQKNMQLYWLGMFYNLFLPGGIGGDAYKVILLNRTFQYPAKQLTAAILLDRISGVVGLGILAVIYYFAVFEGGNYATVLLIAAVPGLVLYYFIVKKFFPSFVKGFWSTLWLGLAVQALQVFCAYAIMQALHINEHQTVYILLFLLSSIVAILPLTIGGLGAREVVFLWGSNTILHLTNDATPVSISITFYLITLAISFAGVYGVYKAPLKKTA